MKDFIQKPLQKLKIFGIILTAITLVAILGTYFISNPNLFRGEILQFLNNDLAPQSVGDGVFIPNNYVARAGEVGEIQIVSNIDLGSVNAMSFDLLFNKQQVNALEVIVNGTPLQGFIANINNNNPLGASVALAAANPVNVISGNDVVLIRMQIADDLPAGTEISIGVDNAIVVNGNLETQNIEIGEGKITMDGGNVVVQDIIIEEVRPGTITNKQNEIIEIIGQNFSADAKVFLGGQELTVQRRESEKLTAIVPQNFQTGVQDIIVVNGNGENEVFDNALIIGDAQSLEFIQEDFVTTPDRVANDNESIITLWVRVEDPLGVSDIDKVVGDLTQLNGIPDALFTPAQITDKKRFFFLEVTVPPTVATSNTPISIPVFAQNRAGFTTESTIDVLVTREAPGSIDPEIVRAVSSPTVDINPGRNLDFFVEALDRDGVNNILDVTIDLSPLKGAPIRMNPVEDGGPGVEDVEAFVSTQLFELTTFTVPRNVSAGTYQLPVTVRDKTGLSTTENITVRVDVNSANAPKIVRIQSNPAEEVSTGKSIDFFVEVSDTDGASDIQEVIIDLVELGGRPTVMQKLQPNNEGEVRDEVGVESDFKFNQVFILEGFVVPTDIDIDEHDVRVKAVDNGGLVGEGRIEIEVVNSDRGAPEIIDTFTEPLKEVVPGESVSFFAHLEDKDGVIDIDEVILNLVEIGGPPVAMKPINFGGGAPAVNISGQVNEVSTEQEDSIANSVFVSTETNVSASANAGNTLRTNQFYAFADFVVPLDAEPGNYNLPFTVTDKSGQVKKGFIPLQILAAGEVSRVAPRINIDRAYTTPRVAVNDEQTPVSLYVFIEHKAPIENVVLNLENIAFVKDVVSSFGTGEPGSVCPTNSDVIVCMINTINEGNIGTWFRVDNIVIRKETLPSADPYFLSVIATDKEGRVGEGRVPVIVGSQENFQQSQEPTGVHLAVATSPNSVEVLFNKPLDPRTINPNGDGFIITDFNDSSVRLDVTRATINAANNIVILQTGKQEPGVTHAVSVGGEIADSLGKPIATGARNKGRFIGFEENRVPPSVRTITPTSPNNVEVVFTSPIRPTSLDLSFDQTQAISSGNGVSRGGKNFDITNSESNTPLEIFGIRFGAESSVINIETETQQSNAEYVFTGTEFESFSGQNVRGGRVVAFFKGFVSKLQDASNLRRSADLNGDGNVDFLDFTIFASFYGKAFGGEIIDASSLDQPVAPQPVIPGNQPSVDAENIAPVNLENNNELNDINSGILPATQPPPSEVVPPLENLPDAPSEVPFDIDPL